MNEGSSPKHDRREISQQTDHGPSQKVEKKKKKSALWQIEFMTNGYFPTTWNAGQNVSHLNTQ